MTATTSPSGSPRRAPPRTFFDDRYDDFLARVHGYFEAVVAVSPHLFKTDARGLWETYLDAAPRGTRQDRTCNACRKFIEAYGGLVTIDGVGAIRPAMWPKSPGLPRAYAAASHALHDRVASAEVVGVFRSELPVWGTPITRVHLEKSPTGSFKHLAVTPPSAIRWTSTTQTAEQWMAEKLQERGMLVEGLHYFPIEDVRMAHQLLSHGQLFRSEKHEAMAKWLLELHERWAALAGNNRAGANLMWRVVAEAPAGWCHVRSGMLGALLSDVGALRSRQMTFETLKRRHEEKLDPTQYQRPQAPPTAGNVLQAEKIVAQLRTAGSLERRFARLHDVNAGLVWVPKADDAAKPKGLFGHLVGRKAERVVDTGGAPKPITWVRFREDVLPTAERIEVLLHATERFVAFVTAVNPDAPPILQWDRAERRNSVSWYCYSEPPRVEQWNVRPHAYNELSAIVLQPTLWDPSADYAHHGAFACFVLRGARDLGYRRGAGFFPEILRREYHGIRSTLEAYARSSVVVDADKAEVCGLDLRRGQPWNAVVRVTSKGLVTHYKLDRWE